MKRNGILRIGIILLVATLATGGIFAGNCITHAKYVSVGVGTATARVARFSVLVNYTTGPGGATPVPSIQVAGTAGTRAAIATLSNLGQVYCTYDSLVEPQSNGAANISGAHIYYNDGRLLAPGTYGRFQINFQNTSEVAVRVYVDFSKSAVTSCPANAKIEISPNSNFTTPVQVFNSGSATTYMSSITNTVITLAPNSGVSAVQNIYWRWPFGTQSTGGSNNTPNVSGNDTIDTPLGVTGTATLGLSLYVATEQID